MHTQRLEPTTTYISPSSMLRDSDGDIGGGKFTRSGSYALSFYFLPFELTHYLNQTPFSLISLSDVRLGDVPMKGPQNGTFGPRGRFCSDLPRLSLLIPDSLSMNSLLVGVCRFLRADRLKGAHAVPLRLRADDLKTTVTLLFP